MGAGWISGTGTLNKPSREEQVRQDAWCVLGRRRRTGYPRSHELGWLLLTERSGIACHVSFAVSQGLKGGRVATWSGQTAQGRGVRGVNR